MKIKTRIYQSTDGFDALIKLEKQKFDLVITDLHMPKIDGMKLLEKMKAMRKDLKPKNVMILSAFINENLLEKMKGVSILKKPFEADGLRKYVQLLLSEKKNSSKDKNNAVNVEFINPFIESTLEVLDVMANIQAKKDFVFVKENNVGLGDISGIIPIKSEQWIGSFSITFKKEVFLKVVSSMLGEDFSEINEDNEDAVAELCNQIYGNSKAKLNQLGYFLDMTIPSTIVGENHRISHNAKGTNILAVYFDTPYGKITIECSIKKKSQPTN
jgi:chemotaxis protein CheX